MNKLSHTYLLDLRYAAYDAQQSAELREEHALLVSVDGHGVHQQVDGLYPIVHSVGRLVIL